MDFDPASLRKDFAALERTFAGKPAVYLDNACATLRPRPVVDAVAEWSARSGGCHGRAAHKLGRETTALFARARARVKAFLGAGEAVFTRNSTEGINLLAAVLPFAPGDAILTSELEHNSNFLPWQALARTKGIRHKTFPLAPDLSFDPAAFARSLTPDVKFVSVPVRSHVTGCAYPAAEIAALARRAGARVLLDAAQSAGSMPTDLTALGADFAVFSAHKMLGPSGLGALCARRGALDGLPPFLLGGGTAADASDGGFSPAAVPDRFEAGLQDYAGAAGLEAAIEYLERVGLAAAAAHAAALNAAATESVADVPGLTILGPRAPHARGGTLNFYVRGVDSAELAALLDETENIMVRAGVHCAHPWYNRTGTPPSVRASFYLYNTLDEARHFGATLKSLLKSFF